MAKEPGRVTSGDGTSAWVTYQTPPLSEVLGTNLIVLPWMDIRLPSAGHLGAACRRLKKMALS